MGAQVLPAAYGLLHVCTHSPDEDQPMVSANTRGVGIFVCLLICLVGLWWCMQYSLDTFFSCSSFSLCCEFIVFFFQVVLCSHLHVWSLCCHLLCDLCICG